jgi:hypothetical protein
VLPCEPSSASLSRPGVIPCSASRCWACSPRVRRPARRPCSCHQASSPAPPQIRFLRAVSYCQRRCWPKPGAGNTWRTAAFVVPPLLVHSCAVFQKRACSFSTAQRNIVNGGPASRRSHPGMTAKERARPASAAVAGSIPAVSTPGCRVVEACLVWGQAAGVRFSPPRPAAQAARAASSTARAAGS